jgi:hypothetical protein
MSVSYDPTLATDLDWVRFLAGDRDTANAQVSDEEIWALLEEEPNKYFAAAAVAELILHKSGGLVDKQVGDLRLKWTDSPKSAYSDHINGLRARGAYEMDKTNYIFKVL